MLKRKSASRKRRINSSRKALRSKAEQFLASSPDVVAKMPRGDVQRLVHELQVYHIELEMQNDELRRTQLELELARERLMLPYDAAPVGFLTVNDLGVIQDSNLAAAGLVGYDRLNMAGQKLALFVAFESREDFSRHFRQALAGSGKQTCELCMVKRNRQSFTARLEIVEDRVGKEPPSRWLVMISDITEQKAAEDALRESEARFRTMAEGAPVMIWMSDRSKLCNYFNRPWLDFTGRSLEQETGGGWADGVHPDDLAGCFDTYNSAFDARQEFRMEYRLKRHDGHYRWILDHGIPRFATDHNFLGYIGSCVDITERKQAEAALRETQGELEQRVHERTKELIGANAALSGEKMFSDSLIEMAPVVVAVIDTNGNLLRTNAYAEQLVGYLFSEIQGRNMIELFVPEEEQPRIRQLLDQAVQEQVAPEVVVPLRTQDGTIRFMEWSSKLLLNTFGKPNAVLAIGHDITERKRMEEELRRREYHLSNFFDSAPIGLAWLSPSGTILRANQAQLDLLGYSPEEYLGHSFLEFGTDSPSRCELLEKLAKKEVVRNLRMTQRRKDGTIRHVLVDANSFWKDNRFEYSSIFLRDITDRVNLEQEILHISEREHRRIAQDLHDGLGQLLVGAAYLSGTLRQDLQAKSPGQAGQANRIVELLTDAVWQTRELSRGLHPVQNEPTGLVSALRSLAAQTQKLFNVDCHFSGRQPVLILDNAVATHLFRIAQEAITNAIKHGKAREIDLSLTQKSERIILAIRDNGSGIPAQPKPGGMGLRIMRYRAGMIGGSVAVQNQARGGTAVVCTIHPWSRNGRPASAKEPSKRPKLKGQ